MNSRIIRIALICLLLFVSANLILVFGLPLIDWLFMPQPMMMPAPPPPMIGLEAGPVKVTISEDTPWSSIFKLLTTVLGTILGIKLINKYVK